MDARRPIASEQSPVVAILSLPPRAPANALAADDVAIGAVLAGRTGIGARAPERRADEP